MKLNALFIFTILFISACSNSPNTQAELNPFEYCNSLELAKHSEQYQQCVTNKIQQTCTSRGNTPGSDEFVKCANDLQNATFVRQQMQIRGF